MMSPLFDQQLINTPCMVVSDNLSHMLKTTPFKSVYQIFQRSFLESFQTVCADFGNRLHFFQKYTHTVRSTYHGVEQEVPFQSVRVVHRSAQMVSSFRCDLA